MLIQVSANTCAKARRCPPNTTTSAPSRKARGITRSSRKRVSRSRDYEGQLLSHKDGKQKYEASPENKMGFMFSLRHNGISFWCDATEEVPGPGRLINHSRCHANVSTSITVMTLSLSLSLPWIYYCNDYS